MNLPNRPKRSTSGREQLGQARSSSVMKSSLVTSASFFSTKRAKGS